MAEAPLSDTAKQDLQRLLDDQKDYLPGLSSDEKGTPGANELCGVLTELVKVNDEVVKMYQAMPQPLFGVGIDAMAAQDAWGCGFPVLPG